MNNNIKIGLVVLVVVLLGGVAVSRFQKKDTSSKEENKNQTVSAPPKQTLEAFVVGQVFKIEPTLVSFKVGSGEMFAALNAQVEYSKEIKGADGASVFTKALVSDIKVNDSVKIYYKPGGDAFNIPAKELHTTKIEILAK